LINITQPQLDPEKLQTVKPGKTGFAAHIQAAGADCLVIILRI
jgi:hypothetical protein